MPQGLSKSDLEEDARRLLAKAAQRSDGSSRSSSKARTDRLAREMANELVKQATARGIEVST